MITGLTVLSKYINLCIHLFGYIYFLNLLIQLSAQVQIKNHYLLFWDDIIGFDF